MLLIHANASLRDTSEGTATVHLAYTLISAVILVEAVTCVPPPFCPVYQPPKV